MNAKPNTQELTQTGRSLGVDIVILDENDSKQYIKRVIELFKPFKITGHLSIGEGTLTIPLEGNEFSYSKYLKSEPAYIFFDQESRDRNTVVTVKDTKLIGNLMENSYGMEYFVSNEKSDFLIAVNWYAIEVAGSAKESLTTLNGEGGTPLS
ncbi:hypothetical protein FE783_08035 [Paenibacillus mesophilus]|uniref:hypothetical protein n=1 Tax=Paenibacillus mesophilus TaxID=2582849 RepID=UPI00110D2A46|nr:hypothetical protein [Paenibacillus mesophilus]TMV50634.1 hypothetical protein FE783_08035 [Paenibacillus mesophilus]